MIRVARGGARRARGRGRRARDDARRARVPAGRRSRGRPRVGAPRCAKAGAVPATIGVLDGEIVVGLTEHELERFDATARKLGPRDLAAAVVQRAVGATTVGGTLAVCRAAGIRFMATGGLGGVHRGWPTPPDVSADLQRARVDAGAGRLVRRQVAARRARDVGAARDARRAGARLPHRRRCRSSTRRTAARRSRRASSQRREAARDRTRRTGSSAAAASCSAGRPTRASTTSSR